MGTGNLLVIIVNVFVKPDFMNILVIQTAVSYDKYFSRLKELEYF